MTLKHHLKKVMPLLSSVAFVLVCFVIASPVRAVVPAPDGGYPGFNTAEGQNALFNLTTGVGNTAVGWFSLWSDTDGSYNTAVGAGTLLFNVGNQSTSEGSPKHGHWDGSAFEQHDRGLQHGHWNVRPFLENHRRGQHGHSG